MKIVSWNVNGIRAAMNKGFMQYLKAESPDILCLQETKATTDDLDMELINPKGYHAFWNSGKRAGYAGVATFTKQEPLKTEFGFGLPQFDEEGRIIMTEFKDFMLFNIYFPNGQKDEIRLQYKLDFYDAFLKACDELRAKGKGIIISGDYNTAHKEIDLAHPKANEKRSGFLPIEREWMDKLVSHGFVDSLRHFRQEKDLYSWWTYRTNAREKNVGWRIDYHFVSENLVKRLKNAYIQCEILGSDHCPVVVELE